MIPTGTYLAKVLEHEPGYSSKKGVPQIRLKWGLTNNGQEGSTIDQYLYFTESSAEISYKVLDAAGWDGVSDEIELKGLGSVQAEIVVQHEEYEGKTRERVAFVNKPGEGPSFGKPVDDKEAFRRQMRAMRAVAGRPVGAAQQEAPQGSRDDIPY